MALLSNLTALLSCLEPLFITKQMQSFNYRNVAGLDNKEEYFFQWQYSFIQTRTALYKI